MLSTNIKVAAEHAWNTLKRYRRKKTRKMSKWWKHVRTVEYV